MTGVPMPEREFTNTAQLITTAGDPATAQAQLEAALAAVGPTLAALTPPVQLLPETEQGMMVLSQR